MYLKYYPHDLIASLCDFLPQGVKKSGMKKLVEQTFKGNQSGGYKTLYQIRNDSYARFSQRKIFKVIMEDKN